MVTLRGEFQSKISQIAEKIVEEKLSNYENVAKNFAPFFKAEGLKDQFDQKVDTKTMDSITNKMRQDLATKSQVKDVHLVMENLNHRLKQLSII